MTGPGASLVRSDATAIPLGDNTVDLIVTSPPYFALRSYQDGGEHYGGQIGSEDTPTAFLEALWAVTAECWRVLKPTGSLFVNLGDKYVGSAVVGSGGKGEASKVHGGGSNLKANTQSDGRRVTYGATRAKSLMGLPWRYAIGCIDGQADPDGCGWVLRSEIVWSKPNGLPESVTDRVRRSHEQWFHLTKEGRYYSNVDEVRENYSDRVIESQKYVGRDIEAGGKYAGSGLNADGSKGILGLGSKGMNPLGKLPGSVWTVPTQPLIVPDWLDVDHFAAFPTEWPRKLILGWTPSGICTVCGEGRRSTTDKTVGNPGYSIDQRERTSISGGPPTGGNVTRVITGEACGCPDTSAPTTPAIVLDPFGGTGTTAMVAKALGRYGISLDLSADYLKLARWRVFDSGHADKAIARTNTEAQLDIFGTLNGPQIVEEAGRPAAALDTPEVVSAASGEPAPTTQEN